MACLSLITDFSGELFQKTATIETDERCRDNRYASVYRAAPQGQGKSFSTRSLSEVDLVSLPSNSRR